ncbi:MAG: hypothetical protein JNK45_08595 [Myxococcales bacterium]|nr:hypothetical protein [Myxococcales bacterium]
MPNAVPRTPVAMPVFAAPPIAQPSDPRRAVEAIDRGEAPQPMDADAHTPVPRAGGMRPPTEPSPGEGTDRVPSAEHASVLGIPRGRFAGWLAGGCVLATAVGIGLGTWIIDVPAPMPKPIVHRDSPSVASGPTPTPSAGPRLEPRIEPAPTSAAPRHATTVAPAASASPAAPKVEPPDATIPASVAVAPAGPPPIPAADPVPVTASADTRPSVVSSKPKAKPAASLVAVELRVEWVGPGVEVKLAGKRYTVTDSVMLELAAGKHRIKWRRIGSDAWIDGGVFTLRPGVAHLMQFGNFGERGGVRHVERKR